MKKTKKQPVLVSLAYPDGSRFEVRIPLWKAYMILAHLEYEKSKRDSSPKIHSMITVE